MPRFVKSHSNPAAPLLNENQSLEKICGQFQDDWANDYEPTIADFLLRVSDEERPNALAALIPIDVKNRYEKGELPIPDDYASLGEQAIKIAEEEIELADIPGELGLGTAIHDSGLQDKSNAEPSKYIGRYKLLRKIGQGGMGEVWLAEQEEPVKRRVALKVIRSEIDSKAAIARFEAERQAIALMDHQNIAKILDAGTTEAGSPYFVMELVTGIPLNKYCDKHRLTISERLKLLIPVCMAVQHAHQKGIIHRDLKHSNVLVTEYDGKPVPKVIDFGLAKALGPTLTDKTMFTEVGRIVGTLHYMSPEQAEANNADIDTRSDVYSLGVMLYKLLTGSTPLQQENSSDKSFLSTLKTVREKEPKRPSATVETINGTVTKICARRNIEPGKLSTLLRGELDWIVMKALEKDRRDRYETANGLAMELERFLNDEPVRARPPSTVYSIKKFIRRNRKLFATFTTIVLLLVAGIVATSLATYWAVKERNRANRKSNIARIETENARLSETAARESELRRKKLQAKAEVQLHAMRLKSAWSDWQLGNVESALQMMNQLSRDELSWECRYLRTEFSASQDVLYGHSRFVLAVSVSPDGKLLASCSNDNSIKVWNAKTRKLLFTKHLLESGTDVAFSSNGLVACSDRSNLISIYHTLSGELVATHGPYRSDITCLSFSHDNTLLVAGSDHVDTYHSKNRQEQRDGFQPNVLLIDTDTGAIRQELSGHEQVVTGIACSDDDKTIVSSSDDGAIRIWALTGKEFKLKKTIEESNFEVNDVAISSAAQLIASCDGKTIRLWDLTTGLQVRTLVGHRETIESVCFSPDGTKVASASKDRTAMVWSTEGKRILICQGHYAPINTVSFSGDGQEIITGSDDQNIRVWNARHKTSTIESLTHSEVVWSASFSPDGKLVVSTCEDSMVAITDAETGELVGKKFSHTPESSLSELSEAELSEEDEAPEDRAALCSAISPNGKWIATAGADSTIRIWDLKTRDLIEEIDDHDNFIWDLDFSHDGKFLGTASSDRTAKIWSTSDWSLVKSLEKHEHELASIQFSRNGEYIVTAGDDKSIKLWNAKTFELVHSFMGHQNTIWRAVFSPDSKMIASSGYAGEIILWDIESKQQIWMIEAHSSQVAGLTFSPDGSRLVSASDDGTVKFWEVNSGIELFVLRDVSESYAVSVAFSDDGNKMVVGGKEWVTIRSAQPYSSSDTFLLPHDVEQLTVRGLLVVTDKSSSPEQLRQEMEIAQRCCDCFPSFRTYTNLGIAQYRLGNYEAATKSLEEAYRIEPFAYGEPDLRPDIEGYLAMAHLKTGDQVRAHQILEVFETEYQRAWTEDSVAQELYQSVSDVFGAPSTD